jgi:tetratricopeptide (TPR) repeat protein
MPHEEEVAKLNADGQQFLSSRKLKEAESCFRRAAGLQPSWPNLWFNLGAAIQEQGRLAEAAECFQESLKLAPDSMPVLMALGRALLLSGKMHEALPLLRRSAEANPQSAGVQLHLAHALFDTGALKEARTASERVMSMQPKNYSAILLLGRILQQEGDFAQAAELFRLAISLDPQKAPPYFGLAHSKRITDEDRHFVNSMERVLAFPDAVITREGRCLLNYALGKAYEDLELYERAFSFYERANEIESVRRSHTGRQFDANRHAELMDILKRTFAADIFQDQADLGDSSEQPVFIVGMIRSGTTLVEQILSRHPQVAAAGELTFWRDRGVHLVAMAREGRLSVTSTQTVSSEYLETLRKGAISAQRITDKMPLNYMALGLIHLFFPRAKIVHCRRDPADNCTSVYLTPYRDGPEFAYNREDIAFAYREYEGLMKHWRTVIQASSLMDVQYESLVEDPEPIIRGMISFLDLTWDEACLNPESNPSTVRTPSQFQVRQPIYRNSVGRFERFRDWMPEFQELM